VTRSRLLWIVGVSVALWCSLGAFARATTGARTTADEPQYLMTALSLARDGDLDVANQRAAGDYRAFHAVGLPLQEAIQADGSRISPHNPLLPLLVSFPTTLGGWLAAKLVLAIVAGGLAALMLFVSEVRLGVERGIALPTVLAVSTSAPLAIYATQVYPEIVAAFVVTAAVAVATIDPPRRRHAVALIAIVSALPWLSVKYAPVAMAIGVVALVRWKSNRATLVVTGLASAALFALLHVRWYGGLTPYAVGWHFQGGQLDVVGRPDYFGRSTRLIGLFVDRNFGLAIWQPLLLAAIPACASLARRNRSLALLIGLPALAGWLNASFVALTMHGWWFPGRQMIVVIPCLTLAIAWWSQHVSSITPRALWTCAALGATVYLWLVVQVVVTDTRLVTTFDQLTHPWWFVARFALPDLRADGSFDAVLLSGWALLALAVAIQPIRTRLVRSRVVLQGAS
jgi:hypothetical protein